MYWLAILSVFIVVILALFGIVMAMDYGLSKRCQYVERQEVNLDLNGRKLREINIELSSPIEIYVNQPPTSRMIPFPYEVVITLIFEDGFEHAFHGFNADIKRLALTYWPEVLDHLYDNWQIDNPSSIPEFQAGGTTFKLATVNVFTESQYRYPSGESLCETCSRCPENEVSTNRPFNRQKLAAGS